MKNVDWGKWAAIAEILSAVAIVVTLLYLADQTRQLRAQTEQNTEALQANARQASLDQELELIYKAIEYPVVYRGTTTAMLELSFGDYTDEDLIRMMLWEIATIRTREGYWRQFKEGALNREVWESYRSVLVARIKGREQTQQAWDFYSGQFDPEFAAEVNSYLRE